MNLQLSWKHSCLSFLFYWNCLGLGDVNSRRTERKVEKLFEKICVVRLCVCVCVYARELPDHQISRDIKKGRTVQLSGCWKTWHRGHNSQTFSVPWYRACGRVIKGSDTFTGFHFIFRLMQWVSFYTSHPPTHFHHPSVPTNTHTHTNTQTVQACLTFDMLSKSLQANHHHLILFVGRLNFGL